MFLQMLYWNFLKGLLLLRLQRSLITSLTCPPFLFVVPLMVQSEMSVET
uniref:Uncharacterized protein n=1 Tax=Arundo donax TaxID=35708 RepID=A0A0A9EAV8_ARUDO